MCSPLLPLSPTPLPPAAPVWTHLQLPREDKTPRPPQACPPEDPRPQCLCLPQARGEHAAFSHEGCRVSDTDPATVPHTGSARILQQVETERMQGLASSSGHPRPMLCSAHGLWCQDCTLTTNSSHCNPKLCSSSDTVCASVRITDPSSSRKDHSVNKMCASSCDFIKRHFFSDYLMGFINSGILKVDVECCEKDLCNGVAAEVGHSAWALAVGLLLSLASALPWAEPRALPSAGL
ncbi:lymphocyte antigen 6H isoform X3 [Cavia porcellus]|uniref:lymphocyte antigen 6H isoform X3 n=1 Tax=Cavia porcellus TaxID=10141 RepID=UPI002FE268B6